MSARGLGGLRVRRGGGVVSPAWAEEIRDRPGGGRVEAMFRLLHRWAGTMSVLEVFFKGGGRELAQAGGGVCWDAAATVALGHLR